MKQTIKTIYDKDPKSVMLPPIRASTNLKEEMNLAVNHINKYSDIHLKLPDFRRLAYRAICESVLLHGARLDLDLDLKRVTCSFPLKKKRIDLEKEK